MKTKKPNFRVKHPYQNLINSICMGLILLLSSILSVFLINSNTPGVGFVDAYGGNGSEERPYLIYNLDDLKNVSVYSKRSMVAGYGNSRRNFKLMADIDAADINGVVDNQFNGTFDGNNKTITSSMQVFNTIEKGSTVKNLNIVTKQKDSLFDPFSEFSQAVYQNNLLYDDLIDEISDHDVKIQYGLDSIAANNTIYIAYYYAEGISHEIQVAETKLETETDGVQLIKLKNKIEKQKSYIEKMSLALEYFSIEDFEQYTANYTIPVDVEVDSYVESDNFNNSNDENKNTTSNGNDIITLENGIKISVDNNASTIFDATNIPSLTIANYGTIENVKNSAYEFNESVSEIFYGRGGIVRFNSENGIIRNVHNLNGIYYAATNNPIGGIVDYNKGSIDQCSNSAELIGGIGFTYFGNYANSITADQTYNIYAQSGGSAGGIIGSGGGDITNCYNTGAITGGQAGGGFYYGGKGGDAGGLAGYYNSGTISTSYHYNANILGGGGGAGLRQEWVGSAGYGGRNGKSKSKNNCLHHRGEGGGGGGVGELVKLCASVAFDPLECTVIFLIELVEFLDELEILDGAGSLSPAVFLPRFCPSLIYSIRYIL